MIFWAIRHRDRGFLPAGLSRGFTHDEPTKGRSPRLFTSIAGARQARRAWLLGRWYKRGHTDWMTSDYSEEIDVEAVPSRKAEDIQVVKVSLRVVSKF